MGLRDAIDKVDLAPLGLATKGGTQEVREISLFKFTENKKKNKKQQKKRTFLIAS